MQAPLLPSPKARRLSAEILRRSATARLEYSTFMRAERFGTPFRLPSPLPRRCVRLINRPELLRRGMIHTRSAAPRSRARTRQAPPDPPSGQDSTCSSSLFVVNLSAALVACIVVPAVETPPAGIKTFPPISRSALMPFFLAFAIFPCTSGRGQLPRDPRCP